MKEFAHRRPVLAFFALAYLGSWLGWSPWWLSESGIGVLPFRLPFEGIALVNQVGLFAGPFAAALVVTRVLEGPGSPRTFLARAFSFRGRRAAYLVALLVLPVVVATPYLVLAGGATAEGLTGSMLATTLVTYLTYLAGGPLQEEPDGAASRCPECNDRCILSRLLWGSEWSTRSGTPHCSSRRSGTPRVRTWASSRPICCSSWRFQSCFPGCSTHPMAVRSQRYSPTTLSTGDCCSRETCSALRSRTRGPQPWRWRCSRP